MADPRKDAPDKPEIDIDNMNVKKGPQNRKEEIYEKIRIPVPVLDAIIVALVIALALVLIFGRSPQA